MATWHGKDFHLKHSMTGTPIDLMKGAKNRFRFEPLMDVNDEIYMYKFCPNGGSGDMADAWFRCSKLLPQPGATLTWFLDDELKLDKEASDYTTKLKALVKHIETHKIKDPSMVFERLVGTVTVDDVDSPVTFYRVQNVFKKQDCSVAANADAKDDKPDDRMLLIGVVNLISAAAPVGTVAADN